MTSNYQEISRDHKERYGTDVARYGQQLLVDRYDDRTHFIYELLQNAEDALKRRGEDWPGSRQVKFELAEGKLVVSHYGHPFTDADVRSICAIAMSTKGDEAIGKFGIGFKSVYTFTDHPEIHSGNEDFAITHYVHPSALPKLDRAFDETKIVLPLTVGADTANADLTKGLKVLGPSALLFLRNITELSWSIEGGASGLYLRDAAIDIGPNVSRVKVIGQSSGNEDIDQEWLVFHKEVGKGRLEIAFSLTVDKDDQWSVQSLASSPLVVYFPTAYQTRLGFLVQGPFLTKPSRDNIKSDADWNHHLVDETAELLVEAMAWMRDENKLDVSALRCLPLDRAKFPDGWMFAPVFDAVRLAFLSESFLPCFDGGYVAAGQARLARTQELRELFSPEQIAALFESKVSAWLTGDITLDREPEIRQYLMRELGIAEVTPTTLVPRLSSAFLEGQTDQWILRLYEFLSGQEAAMRRRLDEIPLIRLDDGAHVVARKDGVANAFLPSDIETGFPTMRHAVCTTAEVRSFLLSLGITEPDPIDDVVWNVLPKYRQGAVDVDHTAYAADIGRILSAFGTDSKAQREKLLTALRETSFVVVVDLGNGRRFIAPPGDVYIATDRLKQLFADIPGVFMVDDTYDCLRGESMRDLLEACGAVRYPRPVGSTTALTKGERLALRRQTGHEETSGINDRIVDWLLEGFDALIAALPKLTPVERVDRARLIWESLGDLEERRGRGIFEGSYSWSHYGERKTPPFPAAFLRRLNQAAWVPSTDGDLVPARLVAFDTLGWKPNPFLLAKLAFKPPLIDQLAKEAGIDPAALDLLRKLGITSVADLTSRLGITSPPPGAETEGNTGSENTEVPDGDVYGVTKDPYGEDTPGIPAGTLDPDGGDAATSDAAGGGQGRVGTGMPHGDNQGSGAAHRGSGGHADGGSKAGSPGVGQDKRAPGYAGGHPFISYVGAHPDDDESDPDDLDHVARMRIEEQAIALITSLEPALLRTPDGNPGFDLYEADSGGRATRWVEVKSMTSSLVDRPVGISYTQFECAREKGDAYWLYVVEYATDRAKARVLRIQDPVGHARTFTFDRGWTQMARTEPLR